MISGALALGLAMGSVLGVAQSLALRDAVRHPWRWVAANAAAWPPTMTVIFLGATLPRQSWPTWSVALTGACTGAAAGTVLGVVSWPFLSSLSGPSTTSRLVLTVMASRHRTLLPAGLLGLEIRGRVTGRRYRLPVQWAIALGGLAVLPGRPGQKTWWRNLGSSPTTVQVLREGVWAPASARLVQPDDPAYAGVVAAYRERWPRARLTEGQPMVLVRLGEHAVGADEGRAETPGAD